VPIEIAAGDGRVNLYQDAFERFHKTAMDMGSILTHLQRTNVPGTAY
jgi:hypothetical protein